MQTPLPSLISAGPQIVVFILDCISITMQNNFKKVAGIEEMEKADIHHGEKKDHISSCSQSNFMFMCARLKKEQFLNFT